MTDLGELLDRVAAELANSDCGCLRGDEGRLLEECDGHAALSTLLSEVERLQREKLVLRKWVDDYRELAGAYQARIEELEKELAEARKWRSDDQLRHAEELVRLQEATKNHDALLVREELRWSEQHELLEDRIKELEATGLRRARLLVEEGDKRLTYEKVVEYAANMPDDDYMPEWAKELRHHARQALNPKEER